MDFTSNSNSSKKGNKIYKLWKKTTNIAPANNRNQTTEANSYTWKQLQFITNGGIPFVAPGLERSLNSSTVATVLFTRPSGRLFRWKNTKLTRNPFLLLSILRNEENSGYDFVLSWWVVGWGYWLDIEYLSLVWLSNIRAARTMSHKLYGFRKILELCCSSIKQLCWSLLEMHLGFLEDLEMQFQSRLICRIFVGASG